MKKFLKVLLFIFLFAVAFILVAGLIEPKDITIQRTVLIHAPKEKVFEQMSHFSQWKNWSPWIEKDSTIKVTITGTDGAAGSTYSWTSKNSGDGRVTINSVTENSVSGSLEMLKPIHIESNIDLAATDTAGMTKAVWTYKKQFSYPWNGFLMFMNMDKMMGKDFERGLELMKKTTESGIVTLPAPAADTSSARN